MHQRNKLLWGILFLFILSGVLVYANSLHNPFLWDDPFLIRDNHFITSLRYLPEIFSTSLYYSTAGLSNYYRPLQTLFLVFDYRFYKYNPFGYHLTSLLFHIACAWVIFLLLRLLFKGAAMAFMAALLFLVHPANSTVVDYISSRADSQAALFMLLSVYYFSRYLKSAGYRFFSDAPVTQQKKGVKDKPVAVTPLYYRKIYYILSLLSFILALFSKEMAVILPFLLLTLPLAVSIKPGRLLPKITPFLLVLGVYALLRVTVFNFSSSAPAIGVSLYIRILTTFKSWVKLIGILFLPLNIHIEKSVPFSKGLFEPFTFISILIIGGIILSAYRLRQTLRDYSFGIAWFFIALLPMANIIPINTTYAEHWLYLPVCGFFLALLALVRKGAEKIPAGMRSSSRYAAVLLCLGLWVILSILTVRQNMLWKDPIIFYRKAIEISPASFRPHNEIGVIYSGAAKYDEAIKEFKEAIRLNPSFDPAYDNLGVAYDMKGRYEESIAAHKKAIELNLLNIKAFNNLGNAYINAGRLDDAIASYKEAIRLNRYYKAAYNNLGAAYFKKGMFKEARSCWEEVLRMDPGFSMARDNLVVLDKHENPDK